MEDKIIIRKKYIAKPDKQTRKCLWVLEETRDSIAEIAHETGRDIGEVTEFLISEAIKRLEIVDAEEDPE